MVRGHHQTYYPHVNGHLLEYDLLLNSGRYNRMTVACARASNGYAFTEDDTVRGRQWPGDVQDAIVHGGAQWLEGHMARDL